MSEAKSAFGGKIIISGEGGQGVQIISKLIVQVASRLGKSTCYMPQFGVEQRGGASLAYLQINAPHAKKIIYPKFPSADIIAVMSNRAVETVESKIAENSVLLFDSTNILDETLQTIRPKVTKFLSIPARDYANKNLSTKVTNMIFLGAILNYLPELKIEDVKKALIEKLSGKEELLEMDQKALDWGFEYAKSGQGQDFKGTSKKEIQNKWEDEKKSWERFPQYCKGCGLCIVRCPVKALTFGQDLNFLGTQMPQVDVAKCTACGMCQLTCPDGAIKVTKRQSG